MSRERKREKTNRNLIQEYNHRVSFSFSGRFRYAASEQEKSTSR